MSRLQSTVLITLLEVFEKRKIVFYQLNQLNQSQSDVSVLKRSVPRNKLKCQRCPFDSARKLEMWK